MLVFFRSLFYSHHTVFLIWMCAVAIDNNSPVFAIDYQSAFNFVTGLVVVGLGWFFKGISSDIKAIDQRMHEKTDRDEHALLQNNIHLLRESLPKEYASKKDIDEIKTTCNNIYKKIDEIRK